MSTIKIITNHKPRPIVYGWQLTKNERAEFDYYTDEEIEDQMFFRYKSQVYDVGEYMRTTKRLGFGSFWHGYASDSFFSGTLIHFCEDNDYIVVGWYYS